MLTVATPWIITDTRDTSIVCPDCAQEFARQCETEGTRNDWTVEESSTRESADGPMFCEFLNGAHSASERVLLDYDLTEEGRYYLAERFDYSTWRDLYDHYDVDLQVDSAQIDGIFEGVLPSGMPFLERSVTRSIAAALATAEFNALGVYAQTGLVSAKALMHDVQYLFADILDETLDGCTSRTGRLELLSQFRAALSATVARVELGSTSSEPLATF